MVKRHARRAGFSRVTGSSNLIAGLEGIFAEAGAGHLMRIAELRAPMHWIAFLVRGIKKESAVGIGPQPIDYRPFHGDKLFHLIGNAGPVMRRQRNSDHQKTRNQDYIYRELKLHGAHLPIFYLLLIPLPAGSRSPSLKLSSSEGTQ